MSTSDDPTAKAAHMPHRWPRRRRTTALVVGALAASALTSCGFDAATDRPYTPGVGVSDQDGQIDVLSAVVVSSAPGQGRFVASLSNGDQRDSGTFDSLAPAGGSDVEAAEFEPIEVGPGSLVNLVDVEPITLTGDFEAGDFVTVTIGFSSGESSTMDVPVVDNAGYYADLDGPSSPDATADTESE
ncbi:hypothetical protein [Nocardioides bigeumensis]|uniref:hypothetical protein n=1 Tax=Nocardioides bigeumensis TaxID=433657 RepID=UPI0031E458E6